MATSIRFRDRFRPGPGASVERRIDDRLEAEEDGSPSSRPEATERLERLRQERPELLERVAKDAALADAGSDREEDARAHGRLPFACSV